MKFIKTFRDNEFDDYINCESIKRFDILYSPGDYPEDEHYTVMALEAGDILDEGYVVSPRIYNLEEAKCFLDNLIENINN